MYRNHKFYNYKYKEVYFYLLKVVLECYKIMYGYY